MTVLRDILLFGVLSGNSVRCDCTAVYVYICSILFFTTGSRKCVGQKLMLCQHVLFKLRPVFVLLYWEVHPAINSRSECALVPNKYA